MIIESKELTLKNGLTVTLRSPQISDVRKLLEHKRKTSEETYFMARYPEEITNDEEREKKRVQSINTDKDDFMIAAFINEKMIGNAGVQKVRESMKYCHRGNLEISIQEQFCNAGLGTVMLQECLEWAKKTSFEQIELGYLQITKEHAIYIKSLDLSRWGCYPMHTN